MKYIMLLLVFVSTSSHAIVNTEKPKYHNHRIIGTWTYTINGCAESYTFSESGIRLSRSNEEVVKARYDIKTISLEKGIYITRDEVIEDNGKSDCSGSTSIMVGDVVVLLLHIQDNPTRFDFCYDKDLSECVGPFIKE